MSDEVPAQAWLLIAIATVGIAPARYLHDHIAHSPAYHDITQPPEDLGWRTAGRLALNLAILGALAAVAVFSFTPAAARFARSAIFVPLLLSSFGAAVLSMVARGFFTGRIAPLARGFNNTYERETQPKRFWASFAWNAALGGLMLALAPIAHESPLEHQCSNGGDTYSAQEQLSACDKLLAEDPSGDELASLLGQRGIAYHNLGQYDRAERDYSRAIELDPDDSYALYNRALVRRWLGNLEGAVQDFDASLRLRADNPEAYFNRGLLFLDTGAFGKAVADFTRAHELDPEDHWNLANRGIAYAWMNNRARAEAEFAAVEAVEPANPVMLRGRAVLALKADDRQEAVRHLTAALEQNAFDAWSLNMRADIYWQMGLHDLARDDDERLDRLRENWERSRHPIE